MSARAFAIAGIVVLMCIWGTTYISTKVALAELPPMTVALLRFLFAIVVMIPIALARGGLSRLPRPIPLTTLLLMGLTGFALYYCTFNYALHYGSASQGALIQALLPGGIAAAAVVMLKERLSRKQMLGVALSIIGVILVVAYARNTDPTSPRPLLGALWMLGSVLCWAVYTVLAKRTASIDPIVLTTVTCTLGTVMLLPFAALEWLERTWPTVSMQAWLNVAYLGVIASGAGLIVYSRVLRELDATVVGVYVNLVPIVGVLSAVVLLSETLLPLQIVGGVIALTGMWLASR